MGHKQDRVAALETGEERLDDTGGEGVEGTAGLVEEQHLGAERERSREAQALLLAPLALVTVRDAVLAQGKAETVGDGQREEVGLLEPLCQVCTPNPVR